MNLVIYGAGRRAIYALDACRRNHADADIVFVDGDPSKVGTEIQGVPVLSRAEAKARFGEDFDVYVSPMEPVKSEIIAELLACDFTTRKRILNPTVETKTYVSCPSLEHTAVVTNEGIYSCCALGNIRNKAPYVPWEGTIEETVRSFLAQRDRFIEELQDTTKENPCTGCRELCRSAWPVHRQIRVVALSPSYPCQLACEYCELPTNAKHLAEHQEDAAFAKALDLKELFRCFRELGDLDLMAPMDISGGEITLSPRKDEILELSKTVAEQVFSNAILYDEKVAEAITRPGSFLNVSLDSGTRETYRVVKGLDAFDQVVSTLRKYALGGGTMQVKYILLPENHGETDLDGFLDIVQELRPQKVLISRNIKVAPQDIDPTDIESAIYLGRGCRTRGIPYEVLDYFGRENMKRIKEEIET